MIGQAPKVSDVDTPFADGMGSMVNGRDPSGGHEEQGKSRDVQWRKVIGVVASLFSVLGFFGINSSGELEHALGLDTPGSTTTAPPLPYRFPETIATPPPVVTEPADTTTPPAPASTPGPITTQPTGAAFDPASLDDGSTDHTPFSEATLLARTFPSGATARYALVAGGGHPCGQAYGMDSDVQAALAGHGCSATMTGDYLVSSTSGTAGNDVLVSVQVIPFGNASTAAQVVGLLRAAGSWDFGIWCPVNGAGHDTCGPAYATAAKHETARADHRYLIEATAVYVSQGPETDYSITQAAQAAAQASGPENYVGNQ